MSSSTAAGHGGPMERLQGSLRHSAIARLLVEGRLSSSLSSSSPPPPGAATDKVDDRGRRQRGVEGPHSPPPPIDLSTNRTSNKQQQVNANDSAAAAAAAVASFSLSTITTMEKLRCILSYEIQSILSRGDFSAQTRTTTTTTITSSSSSSNSSSSIQYSCRLCLFNASNVIELLDHYRLHGDTLAHLGHKSPDILSQWFEYYLKTTPKRCTSSSSQSLCGVNDPLGAMTPAPADSSSGTCTGASSPAASRLDLRSLLLKPFKATNALLLSADRSAPNRLRACSESQPLRPGCRSTVADGVGVGGGSQSRSSTPYTMISGLTDDENQQQTVPSVASVVYVSSRCPRRGPTNGRQIGGGVVGVYAHEDLVSVKCETDDVATSPARSPLSTYSAHSVKDKGPHSSQDSQSSIIADYLGQFQNGRLKGLIEVGRRTADERSPPTLKCEVDSGGNGGNGCSPRRDDRVSHCFEIENKYLTNLPTETLIGSSSSIARLLHPDLRSSSSSSDQRSPILGCYSSHPSGSPELAQTKIEAVAASLDQPEEGQQRWMQSQSPAEAAPVQFRETTVDQEYAYKQYKRLRKSTAPKSYRQEGQSISPCHSKTPNDSGLSGTPSLPYDDGSVQVLQRGGLDRVSCMGSAERVRPQGYDVGVQCNIISPMEPWIVMTDGEVEEEEDDEEDDDEEKAELERRNGRRRRLRVRRRVRRKRAFPADENEMPDITASDADCQQMRCSPCGITFDDDVIFSIHIGCHSHTDPFVCNICGRPCDNKYAFNTHILRGHHPT